LIFWQQKISVHEHILSPLSPVSCPLGKDAGSIGAVSTNISREVRILWFVNSGYLLYICPNHLE
jgi:hypothetical protein